MKPVIINKMEKTEGMNQQVHVVQDKSTPRCLFYTVCTLILGLVAGILVLSVLIYENTKEIQRLQGFDIQDYQFSSLTHPKFRRYHKLMTKDVTFHIARTGETITENIVITDKEEVITTSNATFIFDYSNGWLVTKVSGAVTNPCYILSEFRMDSTIDNEKESLDKLLDDVTVNEDDVINTQYKYKITKRVVELSMLSPASASMCQQSSLVWFKASKMVTKRQTTSDDLSGVDEDGRDVITVGSYSVCLPDGRVQIVTYTVYKDGSTKVFNIEYFAKPK